MTKRELMEMLAPYPDDAIVHVYDPETLDMEPVTGCVAGPTPGNGEFVVGLQSDSEDGD